MTIDQGPFSSEPPPMRRTIDPKTGQVKYAVGGLGKPLPEPKMAAEQYPPSDWDIADLVKQDARNRILLSEADDTIPPALIKVLNQLRLIKIEVAVLEYALQKRGILTPQELQTAMAEVNAACEQEFQSLRAKMGRTYRPTPPTQHEQQKDPSDPRGSPQ